MQYLRDKDQCFFFFKYILPEELGKWSCFLFLDEVYCCERKFLKYWAELGVWL